MHIHVTYVMTPHGEAFVADVARVGRFVQVDTISVATQASGSGESSIAHVAGKHTPTSGRLTRPSSQSGLMLAERVSGRLARVKESREDHVMGGWRVAAPRSDIACKHRAR